MRYREIFASTKIALTETSAVSLGYYEPSEDELSRFDTEPSITLRMLNRLKKIRKVRQRELQMREELFPLMYREMDYEKEQEKLDQQIDDAQANIEKDNDEAKIDQEQREKIRKMAMRSISRIEN